MTERPRLSRKELRHIREEQRQADQRELRQNPPSPTSASSFPPGRNPRPDAPPHPYPERRPDQGVGRAQPALTPHTQPTSKGAVPPSTPGAHHYLDHDPRDPKTSRPVDPAQRTRVEASGADPYRPAAAGHVYAPQHGIDDARQQRAYRESRPFQREPERDHQQMYRGSQPPQREAYRKPEGDDPRAYRESKHRQRVAHALDDRAHYDASRRDEVGYTTARPQQARPDPSYGAKVRDGAAYRDNAAAHKDQPHPDRSRRSVRDRNAQQREQLLRDSAQLPRSADTMLAASRGAAMAAEPDSAQPRPSRRRTDPRADTSQTPEHQRAHEAAGSPRAKTRRTASPSAMDQREEDAQYSVKPRKRRRRFDIIAWFGEILVTAGVLLGLFAFWQVVVTDMQVADVKEQALVTFYHEVECASNVSKDKRTDDPPVMAKPSDGGTFAALHIPRWDYASLPLREGTSNVVLDAGAAGHYDKTVMPGEIGNFSVAAHRGGFGSSFIRIEELQEGDPVIVETKDAWYVYEVYTHEIVLPTQNEVILPVPNEPGAEPKEHLMTMTTCHPMYGNSHRYIVHLKFKYWTPHSAGVPEELAQGGQFKCM